jgi:nicotinamide mononucleotide transporter
MTLEIVANAFNAASIVLGGRNSVHTWWVGIVGCVLFGMVFFTAKLYADTTLQAFFVLSSVVGWIRWSPRGEVERPIRRTHAGLLLVLGAGAVLAALGYGWLLRRYTDAYAPTLDSIVLVFSVLGQLLLVERRVESWVCWLVVNSIAVPLYAVRGLYVTSCLYAAFWVNAFIALRRWRSLAE